MNICCIYAAYAQALCQGQHIYAFVYFALQGNLYRAEEPETVEVKYSGWGFSCVDPIKVNGSCTTKSLSEQSVTPVPHALTRV